MKRLIASAALLIGLVQPSQAAPVTWADNGHTYDVVTGTTFLTWDDARALAEELGGHLVTITSAAENAFVADLVRTRGSGNLERYWLGGYQTGPIGRSEPAGSWAWVTGEPWLYANWAPGEPNNGVGGTQHWLHYWPRPGVWDDMENRAGTMNSYVVEYSVPEPLTLALFALGLVGIRAVRRSSKSAA